MEPTLAHNAILSLPPFVTTRILPPHSTQPATSDKDEPSRHHLHYYVPPHIDSRSSRRDGDALIGAKIVRPSAQSTVYVALSLLFCHCLDEFALSTDAAIGGWHRIAPLSRTPITFWNRRTGRRIPLRGLHPHYGLSQSTAGGGRASEAARAVRGRRSTILFEEEGE